MVSSEEKKPDSESRSPAQSTTTGPGRLGKRKRGKHVDGSSAPKTVPRVERTNALPITDFIEAYIPRSSLQFSIPSSDSERLTNASIPKEDSYTLDIYSAASIPDADLQACFNLIEETSSQDYVNSTIGWSPAKKKKEMKLPDMRYMVLRQQTQEKGEEESAERDDADASGRDLAMGFLSFMVTYEDGKEVIYCYEIHLSPALQGKGIGKRMMDLYEEIGRGVGLEKAMLTVFRVNEVARKFYERLGYNVDEYSPLPRKLRNGTIKEPDYVILSKPLNASESETKPGMK